MYRQFHKAADLRTVHAGRAWYRKAHETCFELGQRYGQPTVRVAAIMAALSPRCTWSENVRACEAVLRGEDPKVLRRNAEKAWAIRGGEPIDKALRGPKVRAFWRAIMGDPHAVVIDGWMLKAAGFHTDKPTALQYKRLAAQLRQEACEARERPAAFQAIVWCHIRGAAD